MQNLSESLEEAQVAHGINSMMSTISSTFDLFKFLLGEKAVFCKFKDFIYLYNKNDANLAKVIADYLHRNLDTTYVMAVEAAKQLHAAQVSLQKSELLNSKIEFVHGDKGIFELFEKNFHFSKKMTLVKPGRYSEDAYLMAFPREKLFIKPTETLEKALNESKAYDLAKEMGLQKYLLPSCTVKIKKNQNSEQFAVIMQILPFGAISLDSLDSQKPGSKDGIIKNLVESGDAHRLALFDFLIGNQDRHQNNIFVDGNKLLLIDHTERLEKKENGFIPGYLRLNSFKLDKQLPICKNELELKQWLSSLQISNSDYLNKVQEISKSEKPSIAINNLWYNYYKEQ